VRASTLLHGKMAANIAGLATVFHGA